MGWGVQKDHKGKGMQGGAGNAGTMNHNYIAIIKRQKAGERIIAAGVGLPGSDTFRSHDGLCQRRGPTGTGSWGQCE